MATGASALVAMADRDTVSHGFNLKAYFPAVAFPFDHSSPPMHQSAECASF